MQLQCNPITLVTTLRNMFYNTAVSNFTPGYKHGGEKEPWQFSQFCFSFLHKNIATNFNYARPKMLLGVDKLFRVTSSQTKWLSTLQLRRLQVGSDIMYGIGRRES
jgi:hypothetical protein